MIYTGEGDDGKTKIFNCDQRLSKSSLIAEVLGSLDETNSFLGWCKTKTDNFGQIVGENAIDLLARTQNGLFLVQAELAGADKKVSAEQVQRMEEIIAAIEKEIPPIKSFIVSGGCELSAMFDFGRTIARRAERMVVLAEEQMAIQPETLAFMNRLSSFLYALARLANYRFGIKDEKPKYDNWVD
ncbi:MAG: cob(I)yrinic acid a,c-diamide adenosyltransferase [Candidatus Paceibacterota bacterium]|jgi:cob(I)alamin adenosyltransferase